MRLLNATISIWQVAATGRYTIIRAIHSGISLIIQTRFCRAKCLQSLFWFYDGVSRIFRLQGGISTACNVDSLDRESDFKAINTASLTREVDKPMEDGKEFSKCG